MILNTLDRVEQFQLKVLNVTIIIRILQKYSQITTCIIDLTLSSTSPKMVGYQQNMRQLLATQAESKNGAVVSTKTRTTSIILSIYSASTTIHFPVRHPFVFRAKQVNNAFLKGEKKTGDADLIRLRLV